MKKLCITLLAAFSLFTSAWPQSSELIVHTGHGAPYLEHTVVAGENWYSIGRLYNLGPKEIASFNQALINKALSIGQWLKIPLKPVNFSQNEVKTNNETLVPVYHIIQEREWMYHISTLFNKVPVKNLEKWNHINKDQAKAGMPLIIGFLKVKTAQSSLAKGGSETQAPVLRTVSPTNESNRVESPSADLEKQKTIVTPNKKNEILPKQEMKALATSNSVIEKKQINTYAVEHSGGGYFGSEYKEEGKITTGQAGTFKSTSGWQDGKYYALMNNVPVGRIVKVINPSTNKNIYAKVLGQLPEMKESAGLTIRISNSAATELGTGEAKFAVEVRF